MSSSFHLYQLQKIDTELLKTRRRLAEIETLLASSSELDAAKRSEATSRQNLLSKKHEIAEISSIITEKRIKIQQSESALYGGQVHHPKELQGLQFEIASLKKAIDDLEIILLSKMEEIESIEQELDRCTTLCVILLQSAADSAVTLRSESARLLDLSSQLSSERLVAVQQINNSHLEIYEKVFSQKRNIAVSPILEGTCSICGSELTPATCQKVKTSPDLQFCGSCGRILYIG